MVRRHRIQDDELPHVMKAVFLRLGELRDEEIKVEAETLFRVLWRFHRHRRGPPDYPEEITRTEIQGLLNELDELYDVG